MENMQEMNGSEVEKPKRKSRKKQKELQGMERPTDGFLDAEVEALLGHQERKKTSHEAAKTARANIRERMRELGLEVYKWVDGEESYTVKRSARDESVSVTKDKADGGQG